MLRERKENLVKFSGIEIYSVSFVKGQKEKRREVNVFGRG
jgi:hypothetical protein